MDKITTCVFDAYGTLFDVNAACRELSKEVVINGTTFKFMEIKASRIHVVKKFNERIYRFLENHI